MKVWQGWQPAQGSWACPRGLGVDSDIFKGHQTLSGQSYSLMLTENPRTYVWKHAGVQQAGQLGSEREPDGLMV